MKLRKLTLLTLLLISTGCYQAPSVNRAPLNLPAPTPLKMQSVDFYVLPRSSTSDPDMLKNGILFGLSELGYKSLAQNMQDIINFISYQNRVIDGYKQYYEPTPGTGSNIGTNGVYRPGYGGTR